MKTRNLSIPLVAALAAACLAGRATADDRKPAPPVKKDRPVDKVPIPPMKPFNPPIPKRVELANGIPVFLSEDHELPLIEVRCLVRAGSLWDPADKVGLASLAGQVWRTGGTKKHPKEELDALLDRHGAVLEASVGEDHGSIHLSVLKEDVDLGLSLLAELLTDPLLPQDKLDQAKRGALSGIDRRNDSAPPIASRVFEMSVFGKKSPLARETERRTINAVTRDDLVEWHRRFVRPENVIVGAYGDATADALQKGLTASLATWKGTGEAPRVEMPLVDVKRHRAFVVVDKDVNQSAIHVGHVGSVRNPDGMTEYAGIVCMNEILGGGGFSSRLMIDVRTDRGLAYSVYSKHGVDYDHPGTFDMVCETKTESTVEAIKALLGHVAKLRTELCTDEELSVAKDSLLNQVPFWVDTSDKVMDRTLNYAYRGFPQDTLRKFCEALSKVTREDVLKAAQTAWQPDSAIVAVCGDRKGFEKELAELAGGKDAIEWIEGPDTWVDPANAADKGKPDDDEDEAPKAAAKSEPGTDKGEKPAPKGDGAKKPDAAGKDGAAVIARLVDGMGGKKAIDALNGLRSVQKQTQDDQTMDVELVLVLPDKVRRTMSAQGQTLTIVFDGKTAVASVPGQGTQKLPGSQVDKLRGDLEFTSLAILKAAASGKLRATDLGEGSVNGKAATKLAIQREGSKRSVTIYVDAKGKLLGRDEEGSDGRLQTFYAEHKEVGGVLLPSRMEVRQEGAAEPVQTIVVESFEANPKTDEKTFALPAGKAPAPGKGEDE